MRFKTEGNDKVMGKLLVGFLATCAVLWIVYQFVGSKMTEVAFHMPRFGLPVSWTWVAGGVVGYGVYRIMKGK